jgi:hypothetical protein
VVKAREIPSPCDQDAKPGEAGIVRERGEARGARGKNRSSEWS